MSDNKQTTGVQTAQPQGNLEKKMATFDSVKPIDIPLVPDIHKRFVSIYEQVHGGNGKTFYEQEKFFFQRILTENPKLAACTKLSLYACFLEAAVNGISLDPKKKMCYITPSSAKVGNTWEQRASLELSPYGELYKRMLDGQIKYADNPKVVYEGDMFEPYEDEHGTKVKYSPKVPRKSNKIIACFIKITRNDGTLDYKWLFPNDMERLAGYSLRKNSRGGVRTDKEGNVIQPKANELYSSGLDGQADAGFWEAKTIKHAFKSYPKMRVGTRVTKLATEKDDTELDELVYSEPVAQLPPPEPADQPEITPHEEVKENPPMSPAQEANIVQQPKASDQPPPQPKSYY